MVGRHSVAATARLEMEISAKALEASWVMGRLEMEASGRTLEVGG